MECKDCRINDEALKCLRCGQPVETSRDRYQLFERMHWVCFHFEYEHQGDPDAACGDAGCPMRKLHADFLRDLGLLVREHAETAAERSRERPEDAFAQGEAQALRALVTLIQTQAEIRGIGAENVGLRPADPRDLL